MTIINNLVLGEVGKEQKFVVIVLSNEEIHFCTTPLYVEEEGKVRETRHKEIVAKFCNEKGFIPQFVSKDVIYTAIDHRGIKLKVDGGGLIRTYTDSISSGIASSDYGAPPRSVVEYCIKEAIQKERLDNPTISIREVKE